CSLMTLTEAPGSAGPGTSPVALGSLPRVERLCIARNALLHAACRGQRAHRRARPTLCRNQLRGPNRIPSRPGAAQAGVAAPVHAPAASIPPCSAPGVGHDAGAVPTCSRVTNAFPLARTAGREHIGRRLPMHGRSWNIPIGSSLLLCATLLSSCSRPLPTTPTSTALAPPATGTASSSTDPAAVEQLKRDRLLARGPRGLRVTRVHMDIVQLQPGSGYVYSLDQAEALLAQPASADARSMDYSGALSFSDQEGVCCVVYPSFRLWEDLVPYPGGGRPAPEGFAVRVRGTLMVP